MTEGSGMGEVVTLWKGGFGDSYTERNSDTSMIAARRELWAGIMACIDPPGSILEVGSNIGINLRALRGLTESEFFALEPNATARKTLIDDGVVPETNVVGGLVSNIHLLDGTVDMVFTSGVLIHTPPDELLVACSEIHRVARRTVVSIEYFSADPETKPYRGQHGALWKRDFGAFWMDNFNLSLMGYGFAWKRATGLDNLTWWAFRKP
jgi:pseudaminic acid biosynthesis-associated methylase